MVGREEGGMVGKGRGTLRLVSWFGLAWRYGG